MNVAFLMGGWKLKTSLDSRRGYLIKFLANFLIFLMIGCRTLSLKRYEVLFYKVRIRLVESTIRSILVSALFRWTIALGMEKMATRFEIALN